MTEPAQTTSENQSALVLFSGGQDSSTCLAWALERFERVETVGFDYGQRHTIELTVRGRLRDAMRSIKPHWQNRLGDDHMINLSALGEISQTSLTRDMEMAMGSEGLPNSFVPGRNLIFLTFAAAIAYRRGIRHLVTGVCETDYSGYPDCRDDTIKAMQVALGLGMERRFVGSTATQEEEREYHIKLRMEGFKPWVVSMKAVHLDRTNSADAKPGPPSPDGHG